MNSSSLVSGWLPKAGLIVLIFVSMAPWAVAGRFWTFSGSMGVSAAYDDNPRLNGINSLQQLDRDDESVFGGIYPSLTVESRGRRSVWQFSYALGANFFEVDSDLNFQSHQAGAVFSGEISDRWSAEFSNAFVKSEDFSGALDPIFGTVNFFGIEFETITDFESVAIRRDSYANSADFSLSYQASTRSSLSFGLSHDLRTFDDFRLDEEQTISGSILEDQNRFGAFFRFTRQLSARTRWRVTHKVDHYDFKARRNSRVYRLAFGMTHDLSPETTLSWGLGPSFVDVLEAGGDSWGYDADARLSHVVRANQFSVAYRRRQGNSTGLGGLSRTDQFLADFQRPFLRHYLFNFSVSYIDTDRLANNTSDISNWQAQADIARRLGERWTLRIGATYSDQDAVDVDPARADLLDFERRRIFVTLQFNLPEFWRFGG